MQLQNCEGVRTEDESSDDVSICCVCVCVCVCVCGDSITEVSYVSLGRVDEVAMQNGWKTMYRRQGKCNAFQCLCCA